MPQYSAKCKDCGYVSHKERFRKQTDILTGSVLYRCPKCNSSYIEEVG